MHYLGYISAEGGPLILIGAKMTSHWHGVEGSEPTDYHRGCDLFDKEPGLEGAFIQAGSGTALLWEMNGAGTAHVFANNDSWIVVRAWLNEDVINSGNDQDALSSLAKTDSLDQANLGLLEIHDDTLLLLWSTENASTITSFGAAGSIPVGDFSVDGSALVLGNTVGSHLCIHDCIRSRFGDARRLIIRKTS